MYTIQSNDFILNIEIVSKKSQMKHLTTFSNFLVLMSWLIAKLLIK